MASLWREGCGGRRTILKQGPRSAMRGIRWNRPHQIQRLWEYGRVDVKRHVLVLFNYLNDRPFSFCDAALSNASAWIFFSVKCEYTVIKMKRCLTVNADSPESAELSWNMVIDFVNLLWILLLYVSVIIVRSTSLLIIYFTLSRRVLLFKVFKY